MTHTGPHGQLTPGLQPVRSVRLVQLAVGSPDFLDVLRRACVRKDWDVVRQAAFASGFFLESELSDRNHQRDVWSGRKVRAATATGGANLGFLPWASSDCARWCRYA